MNDITSTLAFKEKYYQHKGILNPESYRTHVDLRCYEPSPDMTPFVELYFVARWKRLNKPDIIISDVLTRPVVNMFFTANGASINGVTNGVRAFQIGPSGVYAGVKFLPGGFRAFCDEAMATITNKKIPAKSIFPQADKSFTRELLAINDNQGIVAKIETLLRSSEPQYDVRGLLASRAIEKIELDHSYSVESLAADMGMTVRGLQRLFQNYIGIGPKWALMRSRLLHTLHYALDTDGPNWTNIAAELNYSTQPHFTNEFKRLLGITPSQYTKLVLGTEENTRPKSQMSII